MSVDTDLIEAFRVFKKTDSNTIDCEVVSVDTDLGTCVVKNENDIEFTDVRFSSVIQKELKGAVAYPKIGTSVLVGLVNGDINSLYVVAISELESFNLECGLSKFNVNEKGFTIEKSGENLKNVLSDLITEVSKITPTTSANIPVLEIIKQRLNSVLK